MSTYLLTWNPRSNREGGESWLMSVVKVLSYSSTVTDRWSSGNRRNIAPNDRVFLLRQGSKQPGIVGSGIVTKRLLDQPHWDPRKRKMKIKANYVLVDWDVMVPLAQVFDRTKLLGILPKSLVNTQCSGTAVDEPAASRLNKLWRAHISTLGQRAPIVPHQAVDPQSGKWSTDDSFDDLDGSMAGSDGAKAFKKTVSGVKRDAKVRRLVIERCKRVCERTGCKAYRKYLGFIDVHHILGAAKSDRVWNCVALCPNCHREAHYAPERKNINRELLAFALRFKPAN
jgi:hypothetical protein